MSKNQALTVQCVYAETGEPLPRLLEEAFRLYLIRVLDLAGKTDTGCQP